jgi:TonB-linked SusC/RagA family outer membrane protein
MGTSRGAATDAKGHYSMSVPTLQDTLRFSFIGFQTKTVPINGRTTINITLQPQVFSGQQLVVVGYGTKKKGNLAGSVSTVGGKEIQNVPASGINQILGGKAAGVHVTNISGAPGAQSVIRVRGGNSIQGNNNPLYVIDGAIMGQNYNLSNLNPSDIKSIDILKDAVATAIYGTRGSNGVVLITTKNGVSQKRGKTDVTMDFYGGEQVFVNHVHFLNGPQLAKYANEDATFRGAAPPFSNPSNVPNTNWIALLTHNVPEYNADLSVSGVSSNGNLNYYISGGYFKQKGIILNSGFKRYNLTANFDLKISDFVKVGLREHFVHRHTNEDKVNFGGGEASLVHGIIPVRAPFDASGNYTATNPVSATLQSNPLADVNLRTNNLNETNLLTHLYLSLSPIKNLEIKATFSPVIGYNKHNIYNPAQLPDNLAVNQGGDGGVKSQIPINLLNENTITYTTNIGTDHKLDILGGFTWQTKRTEGVSAHGFGYFNDSNTFNNLASGSDPSRNAIGSSYDRFQLVSWLGRVNYTFKNKYILTLVGRADGSSRFAKGHRYGFFPAAGLAWRLGREPFIKKLHVFSNLKLKASYGISGSQAIPSYRTLPVLDPGNTTFNGTEQPTVILGRPENPGLTWETTKEFDLGLNASFLKGRLSLNLNYYHKKTGGLLLNVEIPRQTGFNQKLQNLGLLKNQGLELSINSSNIVKRNFEWSTTLHLSGNRNKVLNLGGTSFINLITPTNQGGPGARLIVGKPAPVFVGVKYLGTWKSQQEIDASGLQNQFVGGPHYQDTNGDGQITVEDFHPIGNPQPKFYGGMRNTFTYKNFSLSTFIQGSYGNDIFNTLTQTAFFGRPGENKYAITLNRWTPNNRDSNIPRAGTASTFSGIFNNTREIENGSYLRLKNVKLSYKFPIKNGESFWSNFQNITVFFSGTNLLLLSNFKLFDPETSKYANSSSKFSNVLAGFADGAYPYAKVFTFGIKLNM